MKVEYDKNKSQALVIHMVFIKTAEGSFKKNFL